MQDHSDPETPSVAQAPKPASLFLRGIAMLLDMIILFILSVVIIGIDNIESRTGLGFYLVGWSVYYIGFTIVASATPGKIAMGIHVASKEHTRAQPDSVILRYVVLMAGALPFGIGTIVSILMVISDPQRRALHDRIAGTLVVDGRAPLEEWKRQEERERGTR